MNWLNLATSVLSAPEYVRCRPVERATWLNLMLWCAVQENGGRIERAGTWGSRQWQQQCGVTRAEVLATVQAGLLGWDPMPDGNGTLVVWGYPVEQEAAFRKMRGGGRAGGLRSGEARRGASGEAQEVAAGGGRTESNEREGNTLPPAGVAEDQGQRRRAVPTEGEFVEFYAQILADLGAPVPVRGYLAERWSDFTAYGWTSGGGRRIENWRALRSRLEAEYRQDYEQRKREGSAGAGGGGARKGGRAGGNPRETETLNEPGRYRAGGGGVLGGRGPGPAAGGGVAEGVPGVHEAA